MVIVPSLSGDEKWPQGAVGDLQTGLDPVLRATPDGVFVLDGKDSVETALVECVDDGSPVDLAEAGDAVTPPPDIPGVLADDRLAGPAVPVTPVGEHLDVLRLGMRDAVDVGSQRLDRVYADPHQVRRVEVEVEALLEH